MSTLMFKIRSRKALFMCSLVLGLIQVGCAHPVFVEPSVIVHSRIGQFPVHAQVGFPGPVIHAPPPRVIYAPPPRVIYAPPPPPRVVFVPRVYAPVHGWEHRHEGPPKGRDRRHYRQGEAEHGRGGGDQRR